MTIDYDVVWHYLPRFSHAEALTLLAAARLWETSDAGTARLMSADVAKLAGIAEGTAAGAMRKLSTPTGPVDGAEDRTVCPALLAPDYFLGSAPDGKVPPTRVGYRPTPDLLVTVADEAAEAEPDTDEGPEFPDVLTDADVADRVQP